MKAYTKTYSLLYAMRYKIREQGFSLIEVIIYIAIMALAVVAIASFSLSVANTSSKNYVVQEVQANGRAALHAITQRIQAAESVNIGASAFGSDPGVLSLQMADAAKNPTVISLSADNGILQITEGVSSPIAVTADEVNITNLVFTNLTPVAAIRENIRVELTIEFHNLSGDREFEYSQTLQTSVTLRQ
jgi:prepilin-type N-terminal cleavage/methylation domain-containing protein